MASPLPCCRLTAPHGRFTLNGLAGRGVLPVSLTQYFTFSNLLMLNPGTLFSYANLAALLGWALLVLAPRWRVTRWLVLSGAGPLALAGAYAALITTHYLGGHGSEGGFGTLAQVAALFRDPWALLAGWVHYLCFDLFTGAWEVRNAQRRGLSHWLVVPALLLTFLFGPVGLLVYFTTRQLFGKPSATPAIA